MMNSNKGVSLVALVVTIIVIIILASISIFSGLDTPDQASRSKFFDEVSNIRVAVATARAKNFEKYGDENYGFTRVSLSNAPVNFIPFSSDEDVVEGYVVDFELIDYEATATGKGDATLSEATFGVDDIYVYDKNGAVYYVKGMMYEGISYYNSKAHN